MKRRTFPICRSFFLGLSLCLWAASAAAGPVVRHHDLHIVLQPASGLLRGEDTLDVDTDGAPELHLTLAPGTTIEEVSLAGKTPPFVWMPGKLAVRLADGAIPQEVRLKVRYSGLFRDPVPEAPITAEDPTYGVAGTIGPQGTFLSGGAGWYPDIPGSRATFRLRVEAPQGMEGVTSGRLLERGEKDGRSYSVWETASPLPSLTLAAGPFRIREETVGGIAVATYFYPETESLAADYLKAAKGYLTLYQDLFGPYPFEKFAVVENFFPTGYGFPSWTLIGSSVVRLPFIVETSLGHEIAHSWWGNGVLVDHAGGNWSEGLTTYVADHLYKERSSPEAGREYRLNILRDYATLLPPEKDFPLLRFTSRRSAAEQAVGYGKGAMVFHMARRQLGDQAFWSGLRQLAREKMFRTTSWEDFADALGRAGGKNLDGFFRQWVDRAGAPELRFEGIAAIRNEGRWRVSGAVVQEGPLYDLQVPLVLETAMGKISEVITVRDRKTPFVFDVAEPPVRLAADPDVDLFRRLAPAETPPTVNSIRGSDALVIVVASALPPETAEAARLLPAAMRREGARILREKETAVSDLAGRDVLFLGLPARSALLPPLPPGLSLSADAVTLNGETFNRSDATLFAALAHPSDPARTAALFLPASPEAARETARKIPHYGKFSFLLFSNGTNRIKGTWPVTGSPLVYSFPAMEGKR